MPEPTVTPLQAYMPEQAKIIYSRSKFDQRPALQIRLLSLHSSEYAGSPLVGDLIIKNLDDTSLQFTALSYVWGDEKIRDPIFLNGVGTSITRNLAEALCRLRAEGKAQYLWADAVCINQYDNGEKSVQVAMMDQIYSKATRTYIWLGEEGDRSDLAMHLVANCSREMIAAFDPEAAEWRGLYHLLRRPWWTRLWIIQEAVLSRQAIVKCGAKEVCLDRFADIWTFWDSYQWREEYFDQFSRLDLFHQVPFMMLMSHNVNQWVNVGLNSWMTRSTDFQCKNLRDRIYGILSLAGPLAKRRIQVTYEKDQADNFIKSDRRVMLEAGVVVFLEVGRLTPMLLAQERHSPWLELPSWCPDCTRGGTLMDFGHNGTGAFSFSHFSEQNSITHPWRLHGNCYKSSSPPVTFRSAHWRSRVDSGSSGPDVQVLSSGEDAFLFSEDLEVIAVRGFVVDMVDYAGVTPWIEVGNTLEERDLSKIRRASLVVDAIRQWEKHVEWNKAWSYPVGGWREAFWRTLIANRGFDLENPVPCIPEAGMEQSFDAWMGRGRNAGNEELIAQYKRPAVGRCTKRAFITTQKGYFGLAPALPMQEQTQRGDFVCILRGAKWPCILRPNPGVNCCTFIGFSYIHGIMEGEYLRQARVEHLMEFWIK